MPRLTLLGQKSPVPANPSLARLETFPNPKTNRPYEITFSTPEFTSLCPVTGQPDFAIITIRYTPKKTCVESKSLKLYLHSFRNTGSFAEAVTNRILDDLVRAISPFMPSSRVNLPRGAASPSESPPPSANRAN